MKSAGPSLTLRQLRLLRATHDTGSMRGASRVLGISFAAVSKALKDIEQTLGFPPFQKTRGRLLPTSRGSRYIAAAVRIDEEMSSLDRDVATITRTVPERISIGYATIALQPFLRRVILEAKRQHPHVTFSACRDNRIALVRGLHAGIFDFFLGSLSGFDPATVETIPVLKDPYVVLASLDDPITEAQAMDWTYLLARPWILPCTGLLNRVHFDAFLQENDLALPHDILETDGQISAIVPSDTLRLVFTTEWATKARGLWRFYRKLPVEFPGFNDVSGVAWIRNGPARPSRTDTIAIMRSMP
ncbi:LysR family transcriptional regulator [Gluconacetobacter tumulisoli]|uniref:LysR family transcriptional regulator n=1 Tax=Gluconacetobacter tumulisoli TaxID=1286189 RepID=A0A7W4K645_9PROT|nr:LysR family transcriptional regulator [Gluconacetobacter tumulisoli]MBB2200910.1 LysR family transcriptional regulator [Gluconacetobacter tumulisoli]